MAWPKIPSIISTDLVDIYHGTNSRDASGSPQIPYPENPSCLQVPCSVQFDTIEEVVDEQNRVTQFNRYNVMFGTNPSVKARDLVVWTDRGGVTHRAFVRSTVEVTGEGNCWEVPVVERI